MQPKPNAPSGRRERGQMAVFLTLSVPVMVGLLGMIVDVGWLYWRREACLTAAQSGAIAAAAYVAKNVTLPLSSCNTTSAAWCSATATSCASTVPSSPSNSFDAACEYVNANGFTTSNSRQSVQMTASSGSGTTAYTATVTVGETYPLTFLNALGLGSFSSIKAAASAGTNSVAGGNNGACVYVLDHTATDALNANNNAQISSSCGVYVNSSASEAAIIQGSAKITTTSTPQPPIEVYGGTTINNGGSTSPSVTHLSAQVADPLSSLAVPWCVSTNGCTSKCQYTGCTTAAGSCDHTNVNLSAWQATPYTLNPGVYCGTGGSYAISVSNGNGVTFNPGMYVINGGGVSLASNSSSQSDSGSGVIFYLTGTASTYGGFSVANGTYLNLTAPTTGNLADVLVYEDRSFTPTGTNATTQFQGGSNSAMTGIIYLPNSSIAFANGTSTTTSVSLVVDKASFAGGAYIFAKDAAGTLPSGTTYVPKLMGLSRGWGPLQPVTGNESRPLPLLATHLPLSGRRKP